MGLGLDLLVPLLNPPLNPLGIPARAGLGARKALMRAVTLGMMARLGMTGVRVGMDLGRRLRRLGR